MMDSPHQFGHSTLMYSSPNPHHDDNLDINASMADTNWSHSPSSSSSSSGQLYPTVAGDAFAQHHQSDVYGVHQASTSSHPSSLGIDQVESSIGPSRVLTRRQRAAVLNQHQGIRRVSAPAYNRDSNENPQRHHTGYLLPRSTSRAGTPSTTMTANSYTQHPQRISLNMSSVPLQLQYPGTPISATSAYSPYNIYPTTHSRSNSASASNQRSSSPALSSGSQLTSISSTTILPLSFPGFSHPSTATISPLAPREKMKKQRLYNVDRKAICEFHKENPNARQEDIARRYKVERSTISKILKHKTKWLNVPAEEQMRVAKHRPSKFPEVEEELVKWLIEARKMNTVLTDALIRANAKETARKLHISDEKFKASSGWVENFKHRHGIRGGVWHGDGKNARMARANGLGGLDVASVIKAHDAISPLNPAYESHLNERPLLHQTYGADMDDGYESESSPDSEMRNGDSESSSVTLQPAWRTTTDPMPAGEVSPTHSYHSSASPTMHESPGIFDHQEDRPHIDLHANSTPAFAEGLVIYPLPAGPSTEPATLAEAEEAINKVIEYVDTTGHGILTSEERNNLHQIKTILFQAGSGVPFR